MSSLVRGSMRAMLYPSLSVCLLCLSAPEALWPQSGDVPGDISSAFQRICLVVFSHGLLASSRGTLEHMDNIGGAGGIHKQHLLQLLGAQTTAHGHGEDVNDFVGVRPKVVHAQDVLAALFD